MLKQRMIGLIVSGFISGSASAATVSWVIDTNNTVPGVTAMSLIADGEGVDWTGAVLLVNLTTGSVHNDLTFGGDGPVPNFWPLVAGLEWDSWLGIVDDPDPSDTQPIGNSIGGGANDLGDFSGFSLAGNKISATWFDTTTKDTAGVRIANISLTDDAFGTWQLITSFAGGLLLQSSGIFPIPERHRWHSWASADLVY